MLPVFVFKNVSKNECLKTVFVLKKDSTMLQLLWKFFIDW